VAQLLDQKTAKYPNGFLQIVHSVYVRLIYNPLTKAAQKENNHFENSQHLAETLCCSWQKERNPAEQSIMVSGLKLQHISSAYRQSLSHRHVAKISHIRKNFSSFTYQHLLK